MRAILFDLDGTLLDLDLHGFLERYFSALSRVIARVIDEDRVEEAMTAINDATIAMMQPHPGVTNREVFNAHYLSATGVDLEAHAAVFDGFYEEEFPHLRGAARPAPGALEAVRTAREHGMRVAIATNPIFPRRAIDHRLDWAGIDSDLYDAVTSYECMTACKPLPAYYREVTQMLGVEPADCLMVGDDPVLDMGAADVGMSTFYVGPGTPAHATYRGSLTELADLIGRLAS